MIERIFRAELAAAGDGRTLTGFAVPFDVEATVDDGDGPYLEVFRRGAFRNVVKDPGRVKLCYGHSDRVEDWIGKTALLREEGPGLWAEFRLDDPRARAHADIETMAYKVRDGQLGGLSVSFIPGYTVETVRDGMLHRERKTVKRVDHVALVPAGAYPSVEPLAVREKAHERSSIETWREWRQRLTMPT